MPRFYTFERIANFHDLGGYETPYGLTADEVVFRSATLAYASKEDVEKLARIGIKSVLDLREDERKKAEPDPVKGDPRFTLIELPVNGSGRIPVDYEDDMESYFEILEDAYTARAIFQAILNAPKPMVIHCNAGKDRTGMFCFVLLLANGVRFTEVNTDFMLSYPELEAATVAIKKEMPDFPAVLLTPDVFLLRDFYTRFMKRYGTIAQYFEAIGLDEDEATALSNLLGKQEKSCGAVIFNSEGKVLVEHSVLGHYGLPKGHVETIDESEWATAFREVLEETGIQTKRVGDFRDAIVYSPRPGSIKQVVFFLGEAQNDGFAVQKEEIQDCYWLDVSSAKTALSHQSEKEILYKAYLAYLTSKEE